MNEPLDLQDALALIEDEAHWQPGRSPCHLLLNLTARGEATTTTCPNALASFGTLAQSTVGRSSRSQLAVGTHSGSC